MTDLTERQAQVAAMVARGFTDKQIAGELGMAYNTVRIHVAALAFRLGLPGGQNTRVLITRWWLRTHSDYGGEGIDAAS